MKFVINSLVYSLSAPEKAKQSSEKKMTTAILDEEMMKAHHV